MPLNPVKIQCTEAITGVQFEDAGSFPVNPLPSGARVRRYSLAGDCLGLHFSLSLHVNDDEKVRPTLPISISRCNLYPQRIDTFNGSIDSRCQLELQTFLET